MGQLSLVGAVGQTLRAPLEGQTHPLEQQPVPVVHTRCPSVRVEWRVQRRGAWVLLAVQAMSTTLRERATQRDIHSGLSQEQHATAASETTNHWIQRHWLRSETETLSLVHIWQARLLACLVFWIVSLAWTIDYLMNLTELELSRCFNKK